jgi:proteic killer suppression protein
MRIEFADADMQLICTEEAHRLGLPFAVIKAARQKLVLMEAALDERDLRNWKSLDYTKLNGDVNGTRTIRINDQYRIAFTLSEVERPPVIVVIAIGDMH